MNSFVFCSLETINVDKAVADLDMHSFMRSNIHQRHRRGRPGHCQAHKIVTRCIVAMWPKSDSGDKKASNVYHGPTAKRGSRTN